MDWSDLSIPGMQLELVTQENAILVVHFDESGSGTAQHGTSELKTSSAFVWRLAVC